MPDSNAESKLENNIEEYSSKVMAVVLNKVEKLQWYYFEIRFKDITLDEIRKSSEDVGPLDNIQKVGSDYVWKGTESDRKRLFIAIIHLLRKRPKIAYQIFKRIFDLEEIPNESGASKGIMGKLNRAETKSRQKRYFKQVMKGICSSRLSMVAEGDSWFQFPSIGISFIKKDFVKDIIDHLMNNSKYYVLSLAAAGDWLSNMLKTREYITELSRIEPNIFLFSGGGNDLMGENLGTMIKHKRRTHEKFPFFDKLLKKRVSSIPDRHKDFNKEKYELGLTFLGYEFYSFLNLILVQYFLFFFNLSQSLKIKDTIIITQGYDYAIPRRKSNAKFFSSSIFRYLVNKFTGSGKWLWAPLEQKRLDQFEKEAVIYAIITEFNELLIDLVCSNHFELLYHVDSRGIAEDEDWFDEIHLKSYAFKTVSKLYDVCIENAMRRSKERVYTKDKLN